MFQGVNAGIVTVAPDDFVSVPANRRHTHGSKWTQLVGLQDAERIGRFLSLLAATSTGAVSAKMLPGVDAAVPVAPFDNQAFGAVFLQRQRHEWFHIAIIVADMVWKVFAIPCWA